MTDQPDLSSETKAALSLLSAAAVRERSHQLLQAGLDGRLEHFTVDLDRLEPCADEVVATIREAYPVSRHPVPCPLAPFLGRRA